MLLANLPVDSLQNSLVFHVQQRAHLRVRGQGQSEQGLKASVDPGQPEVQQPAGHKRELLVILSEIGTHMSRWPSVKHFCSWLGLCPIHKVSGGKVLSRRVRPGANRVAVA